ncbi:MAG: DUF1987 domain-containing protein [Bacteroidales bacterium]|nr:DUF1987 domain-containing protein [Bacteroidales bacterium]
MELVDNKLLIEATDDTPSIIIDGDKRFVRFEGPSFPENAVEFYSPIIEGLLSLIPTWKGEITMEFEFSILSSASNKVVYELLVRLEKLHEEGADIHINWIYETYDEDMFDEGSGYKECLKMPIELVERPSE